MSKKITELVSQTIFSIPNNKLHSFPFKVILLECNAVSHPSFTCLYALLEGFFWDASQLCCYSSLDSLHAFKMGLLENHFELGEKKKSHIEQNQVNRKVVQVEESSSQPGTAGYSGCCEQVHCHGKVATICPAISLISSHALSKAYATESPCRLTDWSGGFVARTHCGHCSSQWKLRSKWLSCFLQCWILSLKILEFGFQVILKSLITSDDSAKHFCFSLKMLSDIQCSFWSLFSHLVLFLSKFSACLNLCW